MLLHAEYLNSPSPICRKRKVRISQWKKCRFYQFSAQMLYFFHSLDLHLHFIYFDNIHLHIHLHIHSVSNCLKIHSNSFKRCSFWRCYVFFELFDDTTEMSAAFQKMQYFRACDPYHDQRDATHKEIIQPRVMVKNEMCCSGANTIWFVSQKLQGIFCA